jgi:hypothetical protein
MTTVLDPGQIVSTLQKLRRRIAERFPKSGLNELCEELLSLAEGATETCALLARPLIGLRVTVGIVIVFLVGSFVGALGMVKLPERLPALTEFVQFLEAGVNSVVLIGAAAFFLLTIETRIKRRRALRIVNQLRALAHVVDIHQLTKDPDCITIEGRFEMGRYLDYCVEMLSLIGKIAALYAQHIEDSVALDAVDNIEGLTTGLSRKIWQKIMMLREA